MHPHGPGSKRLHSLAVTPWDRMWSGQPAQGTRSPLRLATARDVFSLNGNLMLAKEMNPGGVRRRVQPHAHAELPCMLLRISSLLYSAHLHPRIHGLK